MTFKMIKFLVSLSIIFPFSASAEFLSCGTHQIDRVMVQGDRDDNHSHANSFVMQLKDFNCNGKPYLYIKSDHPAYQGIMSMTLAAKITNKKVEVIANTSKVLSSATEISIVIIK